MSQISLLLLASASPTPAPLPPVHPKPTVQAVMMPYEAPHWYADAKLTKDFLSGLTNELILIAFGTPWPGSIQDRSDCVAYAGEYESPPQNDYWVYACRYRTDHGVRSDYAYLLGESERPTLERARYSISAPPGASLEDWTRIRDSLVVDLSRSRSPKWTDRLTALIGVAPDRVFEVELFVAYPDTGRSSELTVLSFPTVGGDLQAPKTAPMPRRTTTIVESLVVECYSHGLDAETHESNWDLLEASPPDSSPHLTRARNELIRSLRVRRSKLAAVLDSTRLTSAQIRIVHDAVSEAHSLQQQPEVRDLLLYAAHLWAGQILGRLPNTQDGCDPGDTTFLHEFNATFATRDRSWIECGHYGDWWYSGGFLDSVVIRAGADPWADDAFLNRSLLGWNESHGCSDDPAIGADEFRLVIARGEAFLAAHPKSAISPELRLLVAEAHETAWSLSRGGNSEMADWMTYAVDASTHRARAMELYARHLREWPLHPHNKAIRKRLARMRIDVDTGYQRFWCFDD